MNKEEKFLAYLEALKTDKNSGLLEGVINGFKTLVEYRVDGNISERQVDIMENSDDIEDMAGFGDVNMDDAGDMDEDVLPGDLDVPLDEATSDVKGKIYGKNSDAARHAKFVEEQKGEVAKGIAAAGAKNRAAFAALNEDGVSEEENAVTEEEPIMEVGEGEVKGKLTPELYKRIAQEVDALEQKQRQLAYKSSLRTAFVSDDERERYIKNQVAQAWRDKLVDADVNPAIVKGLVPVALESMDDANKSLMESVGIMRLMVDKPE